MTKPEGAAALDAAAVDACPVDLKDWAAGLSDRAAQKVVGSSAFLRGRMYARRNAVTLEGLDSGHASASIRGRTSDETRQVEVHYDGAGKITSRCSCNEWGGPVQHCRHVAAVVACLKASVRAGRDGGTGGGTSQEALSAQSARANGRRGARGRGTGEDGAAEAREESRSRGKHSRGAAGRSPAKSRGVGGNGDGPVQAHVRGPRAADVARDGASEGSREGTRLGKRGRNNGRGKGEERSQRDALAKAKGETAGGRRGRLNPRGGGRRVQREARDALDAWLPFNERPEALRLDYRITVRPASITVMTCHSGSRQGVSFADALSGFDGVKGAERSLVRLMSRAAGKLQASSAELRGEDASEALGLMRGRTVLLEPSAKELRFPDEELKPRLELDLPQADAVRIRVIFQPNGSGRRYGLGTGVWFEGTPGWHIEPAEGVARPIAATLSPVWLQRLFRSPALMHPVEDLPRFIAEFTPKLANYLQTELPDLSTVAEVLDMPPRFRFEARGEILEVIATLRAGYGDTLFEIPVGGLPSPLGFLPGEAGPKARIVRRDVGVELTALQQLLDVGFVFDEATGALVLKGEAAVAFWTQGFSDLPNTWEKLAPPGLVGARVHGGTLTPQVRVGTGVDWLDFDLRFEVGGAAADWDAVRASLESKQKLVKLQDGSYARLDDDAMATLLEKVNELYTQDGNVQRLPISQLGKVREIVELVGESTVTKDAESLFSRFESLDNVELIAKPRGLKAELRSYQKRGFSWLVFLYQQGAGGVLADDMGLGKTLQTIALLLWVKSKLKGKTHLVVAPTSVVANWDREIKRFAPSLSTLVWQGAARHGQQSKLEACDVLLTSYALLRRDEDLLSELDFGYVILDEAQYIKNPMSATAKVAKRLRSDRRLALTGTPIENRLSEVWSIFDFISPGSLGSLRNFEERFARPIDRGEAEPAERLRAAVKPFVLRRLKSEVAQDLPPKIIQDIVVPMAEEQRALYSQILREVRQTVMDEVERTSIAKSQIQILTALTRLRQVACDPRLTKIEGTWGERESGKVQAFRELMTEAVAGGHRVLVFSQFVSMLTLLREVADEQAWPYLYLDGSVKNRGELVDQFNSDESFPLFFISLKAGGTGLNLTGADTVVHYDPWWNPAVEDQATDRAHRIGQNKVVSVYRLIAEGTVEEKILNLSEKKRDLVSKVMSTEGSSLKGLTEAEVNELLS